ncbi:HlyD family secretion protein [Pseudenhygromyxa sp. WMMC2535]|uniref:HlyD family efflux transporter periplasmic adaptor subunit n=1 Tax=Pseudenhygromyxa sp. WMMC2535 TaxID=2712867 RepID=UPI0015578ABA|nr:HlyD family secretion protein [Pseudenhygromyxa sp. WMMC2535]NVB39684.1 HlyD family secretion protein [Pseudenhygromyxa sp. WMMC2535]
MIPLRVLLHGLLRCLVRGSSDRSLPALGCALTLSLAAGCVGEAPPREPPAPSPQAPEPAASAPAPAPAPAPAEAPAELAWSTPAVVVSARHLDLAAPRSGFVRFADAQPLARLVQADAPLFEVERGVDQARRAKARAAVEVAHAEGRRATVRARQHDDEQDALRSLAGVVAQGDITEAERAAALARVDAQAAQARAQVARRELEIVDGELSAGQVPAPFDAQITQLLAQAGEWVEAGQTVLRLEDTADLRLRLAVEPERARELELGARLRWRGPTGEVGEAEVVAREPRVRPISGLVYLEATILSGEAVVLGEAVDCLGG